MELLRIIFKLIPDPCGIGAAYGIRHAGICCGPLSLAPYFPYRKPNR